MATKIQKRLASICDIEVDELSMRSAAAALRLALAEPVLDVVGKNPTTLSQIEIARQLNLSNLSCHKEIAGLQIEAEFVRLNEVAQEKHAFIPGMRVKFIGGPNIHGLVYKVGEEYIISTVKLDGRIYFKDTNGASAYASQLQPIA